MVRAGAMLPRLACTAFACSVVEELERTLPAPPQTPAVQLLSVDGAYAYRTLVAAFQAALRRPRLSYGGYAVALATGVVPGVERNPRLWTDGLSYRVYEDVEDGTGMEAAQPVPAVWRIAPEQEEER